MIQNSVVGPAGMIFPGFGTCAAICCKACENPRSARAAALTATSYSGYPRRTRCADAVSWIATQSGNWTRPATGSTHQRPKPGPGAADDVTINEAGPLTMTIQAGDSMSVQEHPTASNDRPVDHRRFVAGCRQLGPRRPFVNTGGSLTASGSASTVTATGPDQYRAASLYARAALRSVCGFDEYTPNYNTFAANGTGSAANVSALTAVAHQGFSWTMTLESARDQSQRSNQPRHQCSYNRHRRQHYP